MRHDVIKSTEGSPVIYSQTLSKSKAFLVSVTRKKDLYESQTREQILENLVCVVVIISSELHDMKKDPTTCESTYIELIFCITISVLG